MPKIFSSAGFWIAVLVGCAVVAVAILVLLIVLLVDWKTIEVRSPTNEARVNPWLAISNLFSQYDIEIHRESPFIGEQVPPYRDTVIIENGEYSIATPEIGRRLENWVIDGGSLIYTADSLPVDIEEWSAAEQIFPMNLGFFREGRFRHGVGQVPGEFSCSSGVTEVKLVDVEVARMASMDDSSRYSPLLLDRVPRFLGLRSFGAGAFAYASYGDGHIFVVNSLEYWINGNVHCHDHAYILYSMVTRSTMRVGETRHVWIMPKSSIPSLYELIWNNAPQVVIGLAIAFLVMLLVWNIRLSPPIYKVPRPRRSAYEYATSAARFGWRHREVQPFVAALQSYALGVRDDVAMQEHISKTAEQTGVAESNIRQAMQSNATQSEMSLVAIVRILQSLYRTKRETK